MSTFTYADLMRQLEKASAEVAACPRLRAIANSPYCFTCQGRGGCNIPYGDSAGWHDCSSCDGTGLKRPLPAAPPSAGETNHE